MDIYMVAALCIIMVLFTITAVTIDNDFPVGNPGYTSDVNLGDEINVFQIEIDIQYAKRVTGTGYDYFWYVMPESVAGTADYFPVYLRFNGSTLQLRIRVVDNGTATDDVSITVPVTSYIPDDGHYTLQWWFINDNLSPGLEVHVSVYDSEGESVLSAYESLVNYETDWLFKLVTYAGNAYDARYGRTVFSKMHQWNFVGTFNNPFLLTGTDVLGMSYQSWTVGDTVPDI